MSVGGLLGLDDSSPLLDRVRDDWPEWVAADLRLGVVTKFDELRGWLDSAPVAEADEVLLALAMLAAPDGGDDVAATAALAKCLLPGASRIAAGLCSLLPLGTFRDSQPVAGGRWSTAARIDELVASQLWIEVRSFPWRRLQKVAANILMQTRAGVLRELGEQHQVARADRTWANTVTTQVFEEGSLAALFGEVPPSDSQGPAPAAETLADLLARARHGGVITSADQTLLMCLVQEADAVETRIRSRGCGGLLSDELSIRVGARLGMSEATVRRRASRCMRALAGLAKEPDHAA